MGQRLPASSSKVLERSHTDRAALIGRLHLNADASWLAELLMDGEIARLRLVEALRREVGDP